MSDYEGPPAKISKTDVVYSDKAAESEGGCSQEELAEQEEWLTEGTNNTDDDFSYQLKSAATSVSSQDGGSQQSLVEVPDESQEEPPGTGDPGSDGGSHTVKHEVDNVPTDNLMTEDDTVELEISKAPEDTTKTTITTNSTELTELPENYLEDAADDVENSIKTTRIFKNVSKNVTPKASKGNAENFNCKSAIELKVTESLPEKILNYQDSTAEVVSSKAAKEKEKETQYASEMTKFIMKWQDDVTSSGSNDDTGAKGEKKAKEKKNPEGEEKADDGNDTDGLLRMLEGDNKTPESKTEKKRKEVAGKSQKEAAAAEVDSDEENDTKRSVRKMLINGRQKKVLEESSDSEAENQTGAHENSKDTKFAWKKSQSKHVTIVRKPGGQPQQATAKPIRAYTRSNARTDANKNVAISQTPNQTKPALSKKEIAVTLNTITRSKAGDSSVARPRTVSDLKKTVDVKKTVEIRKVPAPTVVAISKPAKAPNVSVSRPMVVTRSNSRSSIETNKNDSGSGKNGAPKMSITAKSPTVAIVRTSVANSVSPNTTAATTYSRNKLANSDAVSRSSVANSNSPKTTTVKTNSNKLANVDSAKKAATSTFARKTVSFTPESAKKSVSFTQDSAKKTVSLKQDSAKKTVGVTQNSVSKSTNSVASEDLKKDNAINDGDPLEKYKDFKMSREKLGFLHDSSMSEQSSEDLSLECSSCSDSEDAIEAGFKIDLRNEKASEVLPLLGDQAGQLLRTESRNLDQAIRLLAGRRSEVVSKIKAQHSFIRSLECRLEQLADQFGVES